MVIMETPWWIWLLEAYVLMGVVTYLLYRKDKKQARRKRPRIPELNLHLMEFFFGWFGALIAQKVLRHKTRKSQYQLVFWGIGAVHLVGLSSVLAFVPL